MSVEQAAYPVFTLCNVQRSQAKSHAVSIHALTLDYRNVMIFVQCSAECNSTGSSMNDSFDKENGRKGVKDGFEVILLDGRHRRSAVGHLKVERGRECTVNLLRFIQSICRDGQVAVQV